MIFCISETNLHAKRNYEQLKRYQRLITRLQRDVERWHLEFGNELDSWC
jgi:hypothetical protein